MAEVKVYRTSGTMKEFEEVHEEVMNHVYITSLDNIVTEGVHEIGDILFNDLSKAKFALVLKNTETDKFNISSVRVSILKFLNFLVDNNLSQNSIITSRNQFNNNKELCTFTSIIEEFCLTWFRDAIPDTLSIIICDCEDEDDE